nr:6290_t:CDS:2 [Entrophospora candida]
MDANIGSLITNKIEVVEIDSRDENTPDNWVPRHPEMVRLTGKHPFNAESPLSLLLKQGFITPTPLHYVRNHGPVPKLSWDTHRLIVDGLVKNPLNLSMDDIASLPYLEFPLTMVCAGNRRKEQNMIKQTIGFNWGAAAVSNAIWKGVPLRHILELAGVKYDPKQPRYVCFEGVDKLPKGVYGTSLPLEWVMNEANDIILAYGMNGERLTPDHGFPIRSILPGYIGGRTVKWLGKVSISDKESDSHYHFLDNRVLPPEYDAERATKERIWYNPNYIIYKLNINSAIESPAHDEKIVISNLARNAEYTVKGYAYIGNGVKCIRVEISLDRGKTWLLTKLTQPELEFPLVKKRGMDPLPRFWCWTFWELTIPIQLLIRCEEISVRAWDSNQNTQPREPTWNVMGMMNNCHFKVKVHPFIENNEFGLRFEHPTQPGNLPGGWMVRKKEEETKKEAKDDKKTKTPPAKKIFTMDQVSKHNNENDCWIVIANKVYDATNFLKDHPGGKSAILINAGTDVTEEFNDIHSEKAKEKLNEFYVGDLATSKENQKSKL